MKPESAFGRPGCKPQLQAAIANEALHCIALRLDCIALRLDCIALRAGLHCIAIALHCIALRLDCIADALHCVACADRRGRVGETLWESLLGTELIELFFA